MEEKFQLTVFSITSSFVSSLFQPVFSGAFSFVAFHMPWELLIFLFQLFTASHIWIYTLIEHYIWTLSFIKYYGTFLYLLCPVRLCHAALEPFICRLCDGLRIFVWKHIERKSGHKNFVTQNKALCVVGHSCCRASPTFSGLGLVIS